MDDETDKPLTRNPALERIIKVNQKPKKSLTSLSIKNTNDNEDDYHHTRMSATHV